MYSSEALSSVRKLNPARDRGKETLPASVILLVAGAIILSLALPTGFAGWDDLHYLQAARRWLDEGFNVPANHWGTRLPYVLTLAASLRLFGLSELALAVPNTLLFAVMLLLLWRIAVAVFDARAALYTVLAVAATPLYFRMPTTYYPEVMETACAAAATLLTLFALRAGSARRVAPGRVRLLLLLAGLIGGSGILVRQTALAVPIALSVLIILSNRTRPRRSMADILMLGVGYAVPLMLECLYYLIMTGNPLERLRIDSRHVLIPSGHLRGGTFTGGSPLFNWKLASEWDVPSPIKVHWTVNPLLRVFFWPGLLLMPWLCVAGGVAAMRLPGAARAYAIFACTGFMAQYLIDTFVLAIAPDTRYFSFSIALAAPLAGYFLSRLRLKLLVMVTLLLVVPCLVVMALAPSPAHSMAALRRYVAGPEPVDLSPEMMDAATLLFVNHPEFARHAMPTKDPGRVPVGSLAVVDFYGWPQGAQGRCADGRAEWQPVETIQAPGAAWLLLHDIGLTGLVPARLAGALSREKDRLSLVRREC